MSTKMLKEINFGGEIGIELRWIYSLKTDILFKNWIPAKCTTRVQSTSQKYFVKNPILQIFPKYKSQNRIKLKS